MKIVADLHIHSRYSRATSTEMNIPAIAHSAKLKGIQVVGTGDFTHPEWRAELRNELDDVGNGLFRHEETYFILSTEVSLIYREGDRTRRIHLVILAPGFDEVEQISNVLSHYGKLKADGRPTLSLPGDKLVRYVREVSPRCVIIPAHIWTPWFSLFGANSGFDKIEECFKDQTEHIFALETGLSSDPRMNWRLSALDRYTLVSNSDAHSPDKLGREANVLDCELSYDSIVDAIRSHDSRKFLGTIEFYPEEGKYHYDGHRNCGILWSPEETLRHNKICPVCGRPVTVGVMHRVVELSDRPDGYKPPEAHPFWHTIPLQEIIAEARSVGVETETVKREYLNTVSRFGSEFNVLLWADEHELLNKLEPRLAQGILNVRHGFVNITPGYDGVFGKIKIYHDAQNHGPQQLSFI